MRRFSPIYILSVLLVFTCLSAAWPWPPSIKDIRNAMMRREDSTTTANSKSAAAGSTADSSIATKTAAKTTATGKAASTSDSKSASGTNKSASKTGTATGKSKTKTGTGTDSDTKTGTSTGTGSSNSSTTYTGVTGGVSLLTPASTTTTYFKIGDYVTFVWNYTSLSVTPSGIDVMATCSINSEMYTLTRNMSVDPTGHFTWDTGKYQSTATVPLLVETYTLVIMDAKLDISATASAGHLSVYDTWTFGMYTPQAYTPLNAFKCATCSGALSKTERNVINIVLIVATITTLSFTWFISGLGLF